MSNFKVSNQNDIFPKNGDFKPFEIKNDLLFDCIGFGRGHGIAHKVMGFNCSKHLGYVLLTYFASKALGFRRLPFCEDRIYTSHLFKSDYDNNLISNLTAEAIDEVCYELNSLYVHTQKSLTRAGLTHIAIRREIKSDERGYVETFVRLKKCADMLNLPSINIEMDTLNSFGDEGLYYGHVTLEMNVPIEDVLYCSNLIAGRTGELLPVETGEWVIINSSPTGVVSIPTESVKINESMWKNIEEFSIKDAEKFMSSYNPIALRQPQSIQAASNLHRHRLKPTFKQKLVKKLIAYLNGHK